LDRNSGDESVKALGCTSGGLRFYSVVNIFRKEKFSWA
jgi:hypothetical protein